VCVQSTVIVQEVCTSAQPSSISMNAIMGRQRKK